MVLRYVLLFALLFSKSIVAQTSNENFNSQIQKMKKLMLSEDYVEFSNFVHPKVKEMSIDEKNKLSHRGRAVEKLIEFLARYE